MRLAVAFGLFWLSASPALAAESIVVEVGGLPWKVIVEGDHARVTRQGFWMYQSMGATFFHNAREAAAKATGCKVTDTTSNRHVVYTELDCSQKVAGGNTKGSAVVQ